MDKEAMFENLMKARDMAADIVESIQETEDDATVALFALAIAFTTLGKAMGKEFHELMDLSMTVYKRTNIVEGEEE